MLRGHPPARYPQSLLTCAAVPHRRGMDAAGVMPAFAGIVLDAIRHDKLQRKRHAVATPSPRGCATAPVTTCGSFVTCGVLPATTKPNRSSG